MPRFPIVFIPGFPATELVRRSNGERVFPPSLADLMNSSKKKAILELLLRPDPPPGVLMAGQPIRRILPVAKQAESLYDLLRVNYGYTIDSGDNFRAVGWDWRRGVDDPVVQTDVATAINTLSAAAGTRVVVIVHSTGGLVFRRTLETQPHLADSIEHVMAFGIPWAGNLKAFRYLTQGEALGPFFAKLSATQTRSVMRRAQAAYDLCPPDPARTALVDHAGQSLNLVTDANGTQIGPMVTKSWFDAEDVDTSSRADSADQRMGSRTNQINLAGRSTPPITNVVGWGVETEVRCRLDAAGEATFNPPVRGRAVGDEKDGDGTVAMKSAAWLSGPTVQTFFVPIGVYPMSGIPNPHPRIWDSPPVLQLFDQVLAGKTAEPFVAVSADADEALDRNRDVTLRVVAADVNGSPLPNARATIRIPGRPKTFTFGADVRAEVTVRRGSGMTGNAAPTLFRFTVDVEWGASGRKELPVLIRV